MKQIIQWIAIIFAMSTTNCGKNHHLVRRCVIPMVQTKSIVFQIPTGNTTEGYDEYNMIEYNFDDLGCVFTKYSMNTESNKCQAGNLGCVFTKYSINTESNKCQAGNLGCVFTKYSINTESYKCQAGNITDSTSQILNGGYLYLDTGRIICRTTVADMPEVKSGALFSFSCQETNKVKLGKAHDYDNETNEYTVFIRPISYKRSVNRNSTEWRRLLTSQSGFRLDFKFEYFECYWRTCSSLIIIGREGAGAVGLELQETNLSVMLDSIIELKVIEFTSLEITQSNLTVLPDSIYQFKNLQRLAVVDNQIAALPTWLHKMTNLKCLDLSFNAIESIHYLSFGSDWFATFLDLSFNKIPYIGSNAFSDQFTTLAFLSLRSNLLTEINFLNFSPEHKPVRILHLDLSHNSIKYLPSSISKLTRILTLLFQHNEIETVDFNIPSSLGFLDLSYNRLHSIDSRIFKDAKNLSTLYLRNNRLKTFQMSWDILPGTGLVYMEFINLKNNLIEYLDESLFTRTPKLLDLSNNRLKIIDLNILQKAKYLETLRLDYNNITEIRDEVLNGTKDITILPKINYMNISHNQLKVAPLSLIFLNDVVQIIDLSYNKIERCTWSNMPNAHILKHIDGKVLGSCVENYDHKRDPTTMRNVVLLDHNKIKSLKDVFGRTTIMVHRYASLLCHVHLPNNPFHCDCKAYPYLRAIDDFVTQIGQNEAEDTKNAIISKERGYKIFYWKYGDLYPCDTPSAMKSYSMLDKDLLDELSCNIFPQDDCQILFKPSVPVLIANCSNLNLNKLPHFDATFSIKLNKSATEHHVPDGIDVNVYLNRNNFSQINLDHSEKLLITEILDKSIKGHVKVLDLSHSNISDIDKQFLLYLSEKLPYLSHLYLNDNMLTKLTLDEQVNSLRIASDPTVPFWDRLTEIHLYNNTWDCSCNMTQMTILLNHLIARKTLVRPDEILCATPERHRGRRVYMLDHESLCGDTDSMSFVVLTSIIAITLATLILGLKFFKPKTLQVALPTRSAIEDDDDITGMVFDAFVCYCEDDRVWVEEELIPRLKPSYKICEHKKHFVPGITVQENEYNAIKHSRRTIIVMSNAYLERGHCRYEFTTAYTYWIIEMKHPRLVVVKYPEVEDQNKYETCHAYFRTFTYLAKDGNTFDRLLDFMPEKGLRQYEHEVDNIGIELFMPYEDHDDDEDQRLQLRQNWEDLDAIQNTNGEDELEEQEELEAAER